MKRNRIILLLAAMCTLSFAGCQSTPLEKGVVITESIDAASAESTESSAEAQQVTVPNVCGLTAEQAAAALDELGLKTQIDPQTTAAADAQLVVSHQSPEEGAEVETGSTVTITLADERATGSNRLPTDQISVLLEGEYEVEPVTLTQNDFFSMYYNSGLLNLTEWINGIPSTMEEELKEYLEQQESSGKSGNGKDPAGENPEGLYGKANDVPTESVELLFELKTNDSMIELPDNGEIENPTRQLFYCGASLFYYSPERFAGEQWVGIKESAVEFGYDYEATTIGVEDYPFEYSVDYTQPDSVLVRGQINAPDGGGIRLEMILPREAMEGFYTRMMAYLDTIYFES